MANNVVAEKLYDPITEYFNGMNLTPSEKKQRIATAKKFYKKISIWFLGVYNDLKAGRFLHEKADGDYVDDLIALYIAMMEDVDKAFIYDTEVNAKAMKFATQVQGTNRRIVQSYTDDIELSNAVMMGIKIPEEIIPSSLRYELGVRDNDDNDFPSWRCIEVATWETNWIYNYIGHKKKVESGQLTHTWETMRDEKVRGSHALADGQTVPINEPFTVGGYKLMFPCDDSLGAPPDEVLGCRCLEI